MVGMGSMMEPAEGPTDSVVPKTEPDREGSDSSVESTPEAEAEAFPPDVAQTQKRKGGRKPIYATSEERKQRNRQAQAAFRERRTEYIKQLETTIKHHEDTLQNLQQSHRTAADECLMLRYKNSLLERILLEKNIDVQAELRAKGSPHLGPTKAPLVPTSQASPIQRAMMNRQQQARRPAAGIAPKLEPVNPLVQPSRESAFSTQSPQLQPTPSSQTSSPSTSRSPGFAVQGGISPSTSDFQAQQPHPQQRPQQQPQLRSLNPSHPAMTGVASTPIGSAAGPPGLVPMTTAGGLPSAYYPSPFQKHIDQLEQEYDAQADMVDDQDPNDSADQNSFIPDFNQPPMPNQIGFQGQQPMPTNAGDGSGGVFSAGNQLFDPFDPMLDADPFGLSASMHFPTPFNYDPGPQS